MNLRIMTALVSGAAVFFMTGAAMAVDPETKCESSKLKETGKYSSCRLKVEARSVARGLAESDYSKCETKFNDKWLQIQSLASGQCANEGDAATIDQQTADYASSIASQLAGGVPTDCPGELAQCSADLDLCLTAEGLCTADLTQAQSDLSTCNSSLTQSQLDYLQCDSDLSLCLLDELTCQTELTQSETDLSVCAGERDTCDGLLATCIPERSNCLNDLSTCETTLGSCPDDLLLAESDLVTCQNSVGQCAQTLAACQVTPATFLATGQTTSYAANDDGALQLGAPLAYVDNGDGTITDLNTGLMWEKKDRNGGLHQYTSTYNWTTAMGTWLNNVNNEGGVGFAGYTDWRIPNVRELQSIIDYSKLSPAHDEIFGNINCVTSCYVTECSCTNGGSHWTSTRYANGGSNSSDTYTWFVNMNDGSHSITRNTSFAYIRAVRGPVTLP